MAGGAGTRFWPASRERLPKQFLPLGSDPNESLLAATVRRIEPLVPIERVWIATGAHLREPTHAALPGIPKVNVLAEPVARNTAPCIGWATWAIAQTDPDAVIMVLPSDHFITDEAGFRAVLSRALDAATKGFLTTIGIVPTRPETGYGYIELGEDLGNGARRVKRFVEKPSRQVAESYLAGGQHLWNAGMFFFKASVMKEAIALHLPELHERLEAVLAEGGGDDAVGKYFPTMPKVSIDTGVMEKATKIAVVPGDFGWNDVGSWESAWDLAPRDAHGNALPKGAIAIDAERNMVRDLGCAAGKRVFALVGVSDLVVVETDDAVLILPRSRAQDVRMVVDQLKERGEGRT
jgi:mannose-1-phosphate guanylyltransferase